MRSNRILTIVAAAVALGSAVPGDAASYVYSQSRKTIRACNLLLPNSDADGITWQQFNAGLFNVLDKRMDVKPAGWDFINPLAPAIVTDAIRARYQGAMQPAGPLPSTGFITKEMAPYWDVKLDEVTLSRLLQFDIIYMAIPAGKMARLEPSHRELLRKLVDSGAQLWIDWGGTGNVQAFDQSCGGFFIKDVRFSTAARQQAFVFSRHHPILSYPFFLSQPEINALGHPVAAGVAEDINGGDPFPPVFSGIVRNGGPAAPPQIAAGQYGSGHVILTANNVGADIVRGGLGMPQFASAEDLKFAYNMVAWGSNFTSTFKDPGASSAARQGPGAPLVQRWQFPSGGAAGGAAVIYKGVVFVSSTDGRLRAFDGVPPQDLDGDGRSDDGVPDLASGAPYDMLWEAPIGGRISGPTIFSWPGGDPFGAPGTDVVMVAADSGDVVALPAFPTPLSSPGTPQALISNMNPPSSTDVPPPTYHNGIIYAAEGNGFLHCFDPAAAASGGVSAEWTVPLPQPGFVYDFTGMPTSVAVGWTQDPGTQALDLVAYWSIKDASIGQARNDRIASALMSVRNEPLVRQGSAGNSVVAGSRYISTRNFITPGWRLTSPLPGPCTDLSQYAKDPNTTLQQGQWTLENLPANVGGATPIYADYQLARTDADLGARPRTATDFHPRSQISLKPEAAVNTYDRLQLNAGVGMGPDGRIYVSGTRRVIQNLALSNLEASQIAAIQENGPRVMRQGMAPVPNQVLEWTYWLGPVSSTKDNYTILPAYDFTLADTPRLSKGDIGNGIGLAAFKVQGPPAVTDDAVYFTATGIDDASNPVTALFAFERKHQFQIRLRSDQSMYNEQNQPWPVKVWQPNPFNVGGVTPTVPITPLLEAATVPETSIDRGRRTITIENFDDPSGRLLVGGSRPLIAGIPVSVFVGDNEVEVLDQYDPNDPRATFSNLRWYFVPYQNDMIPSDDVPITTDMRDASSSGTGVSSPTVLGDYVYFGTASGRIYAVKTDAEPSRGKQVLGIVPNYIRAASYPTPQERQAAIDAAREAAARNVVWQERISASGNLINPIAGAGGLLAAVSQGGIAVYDSPATLVVDTNRIIEVDAGSRVVWSLDGTTEQQYHGSSFTTAPTAFSSRKKNFARPAAVRWVEGNNLVVCDTGNNRIVRTDRAGTLQWEITTFADPLRLLSSGEPNSLSGPVDVRTWETVEEDPIFRAIAGATPVMARVYHYLIADRENFRILDLIVRFDANTGAPLPADPSVPLTPGQQAPTVLNWISATRSEGRTLRYESIQFFQRAGTPENFDIYAAVSNYNTQNPNENPPLLDPFGGGIVRLEYASVAQSASGLVWTYTRPGKVNAAATSIDDNGTVRKLAGPRYFERFWVAPDTYNDVVCDNGGVWILNSTAITPSGTAPVVWRLTNQKYRSGLHQMTASGPVPERQVPLRASSAKVLANGRVLIASDFVGLDSCGGDFHGEVFEVDRLDPNGQPLSEPTTIFFSAPAIKASPCQTGIRLEQDMPGSYLVDQPTFTDRR